MSTFLWIIGIIIGGLIIGVIGKLILPGKQAIPMWLTIVAGIVGVVIGTLLAQAFGLGTAGVWNLWEIVLQVVVGVVAVGAAAALYPKMVSAKQ